jgi:indolepyruvate ferredoxin oxidoreductase beta subunit
MTEDKYSILIVGVGGQGVLLASEIISEASIQYGLDIKKSEVHGMSQRGGIVSSHIKIAPKVYSPTIQHGQADILISFEAAEGLRAMEWIKKDGVAIVSHTQMIPAIVTSSKDFSYPDNPIEVIRTKADRVIDVDAEKIASELGNSRLVNTILLGVLSNYLPFADDIWTDVIKRKVKEKFVDINLAAFNRGKEVKLTSIEV